MHKYTAVSILLIGSLLFSSCTSAPVEEIPQTPKEVTPIAVQTIVPREIAQNAHFTSKGTITSVKEIEVTAIEQGNVASLLVSVGSEVRTGDPIAIMDTGNSANMLPLQITNLNTSITNLRQNITIAEQSLDQSISIAKLGQENARLALQRAEQQARDAEKNLEQELRNAELAVQNARDQIALSSNVATTAVEQAKTAVANAQENARANKENLLANTRITYEQMMVNVEQSLNQINSILGVEWPHEQAKEKARSLGTLDPQLQNNTTWTYQTVRNKYNELRAQEGKQTLEQNLLATKALIGQMKTLVEYLDRLPATSFANTKLSASDISTFAGVFTNLKSGPNNPYQMETQLTQLLQTITDLDRQNTQAITQATLALQTAEQNLANARQEGSNQQQSIAVRNAEVALERMQVRITGERNTLKQGIEGAQLQFKQAEAQVASAEQQKQAQLQSLQTQVSELEGQRALLTERSSNLVITAPSNGVIVKTAISQGASVNPGTPIATIIDPKDRKLAVQMTQAQAERIDFTSATFGETTLSLAGGTPVLSEGSRMRTFEYTLPSTNTLPFGSVVDVAFAYIVPENAFLLPVAYTYMTTGSPSVFVARHNTAESLTISKYQILDEFILVEEGIPLDEAIITTRSPYLEAGSPITITPVDNVN